MGENVLKVRFRVYAPNGGSLGILPHPLSWEAGIPFNDMPSLTMTYPDGSDAANTLKSPCEVALELRNPNNGVWTEYPGCRYLNIKRSMDLASRPRIISFTMPSYGWMLKKVRWLDEDFSLLNNDGKIVYNTLISAVKPLVDMINLAKARNNVPGLTIPFTPINDTDGDLWPGWGSGASFDYGQDAWSILDSFARQGYFDWRMNKRALECFRSNITLARRLDTDTGVHIHSMLATIEEPVERTWEDVAGTAVAIGDNFLTAGVVEVPDDPFTFPWGKWDEAITASGVKDIQVLAQITDQLLNSKYKTRTQYTKRFTWTDGAPVPLVDYQPGDYVRAMSDATSGAQKASMRVYQITLSGTDPYGVSIALTLNDRFTDRALQSERWVNRESNGGGPVGGAGTGGGGSKSPPPPIDSVPPKAPVLNSVTNTPYFSSIGDPVSMADVAFTVVTQSTQNKNIDMGHYNVAARRSDFNWEQARTVRVTQPDSPSVGQVIHAKVPLLDSGFTYEFRVQALRNSGYASAWSNTISQGMGYPTGAPATPSAPILSSKLSTVKAEWDGLTNASAPYPAEFREIQVEVSINNSTWFHAGDIFSGGAALIMSGKGGTPTWNVGDTVYVRFKAANSAGIISASPSAVTSIVVLGVTGPDIAANTVTANNIVAGTLTAEQIKAHSLTVESLAVGNPSNQVIDPTFSSTPLNTARITQAALSSSANVVWTITSAGAVRIDNNTTASTFSRFGFSNNTLLNYNMGVFPGASISSNELAIPVTRPGNAAGAVGAFKARFVVTATGIPAAPGGATINVAVLARQFQRSGAPVATAGTLISDYTISANGTYTVESAGGFGVNAGTASILPYLYVKMENGVSVDVALEFSQIEIWQEGSVFIGNGLITAPLVAANAITTDKLDADAITAKHSIKSAYYEMVSQSGGAIIKITENANLVGQSGIRWDGLIPAGGSGPRLFQTDAAGSGGWDPRGFVITGPEQTTNSSGRVDLQLAYGVQTSKLARQYGAETVSYQGLYWDSSVARFRIGGMFNTSHFNNDMMRLDRLNFQNGTYTYGVVTTRLYYPIGFAPNAGTTPATTSILDFPSGADSGFRYVSSTGTAEVFFMAACGTP